MKANRFRQRVAEGQMPVGHMLFEFVTRGVAQMLEVADLDFVVVDMEHSGLSVDRVADMVAWLKATTVAPFVRIPQIQYHFIARVLDVGALGIMVPNVQTGAEAQAIVEAAKYAPMGRRGVILGGANTGFRSVDPAEFMAYSNQNTTIICQIESQQGVDNVEAIASTPGVDVLWVGHFDLTQSMGIPGQFHHPAFLDALNRVIAVGRAHGLGIGIQPRTVAQAREWHALGFNVMSYSGDIFLYVDAMTQGVAEMRGLTINS